MSAFEELQTVFRQTFGKADLKITPQLSARDVDTWDSFNHINLIIAVEEAFAVRLSSREVSSMRNVGDLVVALNAKGVGIDWPA